MLGISFQKQFTDQFNMILKWHSSINPTPKLKAKVDENKRLFFLSLENLSLVRQVKIVHHDGFLPRENNQIFKNTNSNRSNYISSLLATVSCWGSGGDLNSTKIIH